MRGIPWRLRRLIWWQGLGGHGGNIVGGGWLDLLKGSGEGTRGRNVAGGERRAVTVGGEKLYGAARGPPRMVSGAHSKGRGGRGSTSETRSPPMTGGEVGAQEGGGGWKQGRSRLGVNRATVANKEAVGRGQGAQLATAG